MLKTAFFGTSDKSTPILENINSNTELLLCVTKSDRIIGRKKELKETMVKEWAKSAGIEVFEIEKLNSETRQKLISRLKELSIEMGVVADFSFIIHEDIISTPKYGLINIHFSRLPKYRGASPVQHTILNGETETSITFMKMTKGMDEGPLLKQVPYKLNGTETTESLYQQLFELAGPSISQVMKDYAEGRLPPEEQNHTLATYCYSKTNPKSTLINKVDAKIDWSLPHSQIERMIRAFNPWPIAWTTLEQICDAQLFDQMYLNPKKDKNYTLKIFEAKINNNGKLEPKVLQVEGGTKMDIKDFLNGYFIKADKD
ncbi:hypothetical protein KAZ57_02440 [Patescibacteria group bacterium]|nr:hypothetical protein [Patescibacteria group bacterium]